MALLEIVQQALDSTMRVDMTLKPESVTLLNQILALRGDGLIVLGPKAVALLETAILLGVFTENKRTIRVTLTPKFKQLFSGTFAQSAIESNLSSYVSNIKVAPAPRQK